MVAPVTRPSSRRSTTAPPGDARRRNTGSPPSGKDRARWLGSCDEDAVAATHEGFEAEDFFDAWPDVPAPTVLVHGADSPVVTASGVVEAAAANPSARPVEIPDAGHMVFWDNPAIALDLVRTALRSPVD
ncbi:alpha/beta fold hydrolase [Amycolatopsis sp. H20-H5]|uniref:alpha/beta fold hydrolase n=1 Tax=Amycolatopsis sp. H20-H5 TaxID=3046309 RepID=UPI002DB8471F|nr:alpha/beta hydrolase [Amycolatopsis sp. H20-H5]MEC3982807.1 alpha/beta hydrolase [Amycolatopsis sp. H20-H5]